MKVSSFFSSLGIPASKRPISRKGFERLDLLLLAIESIDINGPQLIISAANQLGLDRFFPNKVELWKFRCNNPMRRASKPSIQTQESAEALISLVSFISDYFYPKIRILLSSKEPEKINAQRWLSFKKRFNELIEERMNLGKGAVKKYLNTNDTEFYRDIIISLALSSGPGGINRLRASLLDNT
ncbi:DUF3038 domain-containing protein [Prochlorococcus marinus]|uniref:DUF3038 domain-containing protein n=1 Tax=Prochlorococcus marinus (strain MIT 9211) TaxID=93059 RepID=A9BAK1_PROM4|nr:DUF3038 domain-containing protein [Prochlorococcus marinus]ABX08863.1 conserved hypothetical protein [Prochlorococcus marinus str. MIT 9211]